jgi:hypothetical protein
MNKHLTFFKIVCAFGLYAGQPLKAIDGAENITDSDMQATIRVLATHAKWMRSQDDHKLRELSHKIETEISQIVS